MEKIFWKLKDLKPWERNPRSITKKDFERLCEQVKKYGQYKPVVITPEGIVLGGNMRLRAYKKLKIKDIWVSVVKPKDEAEMIEYALSDNDNVGFYREEQARQIAAGNGIDPTLFKFDFGPATSVQNFVNDYRGAMDKNYADFSITTLQIIFTKE